MLRLLRALTWLRWRVTVNSLTRGGSRDAIERLSRITQYLWPLVRSVLLVPALAALAAGGVFVGWVLGGDAAQGSELLWIFRLVLFGLLVLTLGGAAFFPGAVAVNSPRLLLMPVSRRALYAAGTLGRLADLWIVATAVIVLCLPVGLLLRGHWGPAVVAVLGGVLLLAVFIGAGACVSSAAQWLLRSRRRTELATLAVALALPLLAMTPMLLRGMEETPSSSRAERSARNRQRGSTVAVAVPTEMYNRAVRSSVDGDAVATPLAGLTTWTFGLHALGLVAFRRLIDAPVTGGGGRSGRRRSGVPLRLPGLPADVGAVALAQVRLAARTTRGRFILLMPVLGWMLLAGVFLGNRPDSLLTSSGGIVLAAAGVIVTLLAGMPLTMNQFAVAGSGLTRELLSPISDARWLIGKAVGNAIVSAPPLLVCLLIAWLVSPHAPVELWMALPLGITAVVVTLAPVNAILSALFPCKADFTSIGKRSNPHHLAAFFGLAATTLALLPPLALARLAVVTLEQPRLAPLFMLGWCLVAAAIARPLFRVAARLVAARRENLGLTV